MGIQLKWARQDLNQFLHSVHYLNNLHISVSSMHVQQQTHTDQMAQKATKKRNFTESEVDVLLTCEVQSIKEMNL